MKCIRIVIGGKLLVSLASAYSVKPNFAKSIVGKALVGTADNGKEVAVTDYLLVTGKSVGNCCGPIIGHSNAALPTNNGLLPESSNASHLRSEAS